MAALGIFSALAFTGYSLSKPAEPNQTSVVNDSKLPAMPVVAKKTYRGLPMDLKIPAIGVDTSIEYTGLTTNGDMKVPTSPNDVGWYKYGAIPGDVGSAVIAGHIVGSRGEPAVFAHLNKLQKGDLLQVVDAKKQTASFTVREIKTYDQQAQHSEVFDSGAGTHLNIITCAGEWDSAHHHYLERLVVFADKEVKT
jgi:LPXTG-site transpeptidase (sortase) family protein